MLEKGWKWLWGREGRCFLHCQSELMTIALPSLFLPSLGKGWTDMTTEFIRNQLGSQLLWALLLLGSRTKSATPILSLWSNAICSHGRRDVCILGSTNGLCIYSNFTIMEAKIGNFVSICSPLLYFWTWLQKNNTKNCWFFSISCESQELQSMEKLKNDVEVLT